MEDSIEVMLQEQNSKLLSRYRDNRVLAFAAGAIFSEDLRPLGHVLPAWDESAISA